MNATKITVQAESKADREKVWDYWTKPEHITKWNFASPDWHCPAAENDLRVGGKMKSRMEAKDGSFGFDFEAIYDEVVNQRKISYTMPDGRQAITSFEKNGSTTKVVIVFDAESENPVEMQRGVGRLSSIVSGNMQRLTNKGKNTDELNKHNSSFILFELLTSKMKFYVG